MAKINGTSLIVFINTGGGEVPIAFATSHSFELSSDLPDASNKNSSGWAENIYGQRSWTISVDGLVDYEATFGASQFLDIITNRTAVTLRWSTNSSGDLEYEGTARLESYSESSPNEDVVSYSASFVGTGAIVKTTV